MEDFSYIFFFLVQQLANWHLGRKGICLLREKGRDLLLFTDAHAFFFPLHGSFLYSGLMQINDISSLFQWVMCRFHATTYCAASTPLGRERTFMLKGNWWTKRLTLSGIVKCYLQLFTHLMISFQSSKTKMLTDTEWWFWALFMTCFWQCKEVQWWGYWDLWLPWR